MPYLTPNYWYQKELIQLSADTLLDETFSGNIITVATPSSDVTLTLPISNVSEGQNFTIVRDQDVSNDLIVQVTPASGDLITFINDVDNVVGPTSSLTSFQGSPLGSIVSLYSNGLGWIGSKISSGFLSTFNPLVTSGPPPRSVILQRSAGSDRMVAHLPGGTYSFRATHSQEIHISQEEASGHYTSIQDAFTAHNTPNTIFVVHPGTYVESNPLTLPPNSTLTSSGTTSQAIVIAADPNEDLLVMNPGGELRNCILMGATGSGSRGVYFDGSVMGNVPYVLIEQCIISNCDIGVEAENGPNTLLIKETLISSDAAGSPLSMGAYAHNGGQCTMMFCSISGTMTPMVPILQGIVSQDAGTKISVTTSNVYLCNTGIHVDDDGEIEISLLTLRGNDNGISIGSNGASKLRATACNILDSQSLDLDIQATESNLVFFSAEMDEAKVNNPNNVRFSNRSHTVKNSKHYETFSGDTRFGARNQTTTVSIGEGKYDENEMVVLTNSNLEVGIWLEHTAAATEAGIPGFNMFQGIIPGNCCYFGRDTHLSGMKINIVTATISLVSRDDVVWEYWDGIAWVAFKVMVTQAESPYYYSLSSVISNIGKYHVRFPLTSATSMPDRTLNGFSRKWVRMRVVNILPSISFAEYVKLHVSNTKICSDGFLELYGDARPVKRLPWTVNDSEPANASPDNQDIYLSDRLGVGRKENRFKNNTVDRLGMNIFLPMDLDTSFPLKIKFALLGDVSILGNVELVARWNTSNSGSFVYRSTATAPSVSIGEQSSSTIFPIAVQDTEIRGELVIDLNAVNPYPETGTAQLLTLSIERDATGGNLNDTYTGDISFIQITPFYISWRLGGQINSF